jgi:hypothetical protein
MKNRIAVVLLVVAPLLMFCANHAPAQEASVGPRKVATKVVPEFFPSSLAPCTFRAT